MLPRAKRVVFAGYLQDVTYRAAEALYRDIAARLGMELVNADGNAGPLARVTAAAVQQGADAIFIYQPISLTTTPSVAEDILRLATDRRIPVFVAESELVAQGGLLSYGPVFVDETRRAAGMVARVLKGANPGDLAVDQTSRFEVAVNLKSAKALGIVVPQVILLRANRVIE
jgi:putative ABC transport system substrate-binding protein